MSKHIDYLKVSLQLKRNYFNSLMPATINRERLEGKIEAINEVLREIDGLQTFINNGANNESRQASEIK